jgi:uncharacterized membrane protein
MPRLRSTAPLALAGAFAASGVIHLVRPQSFEAIMPRYIPASQHRALIYGSGVLELACAFGLVRKAPWASAASTAVLVGVFPANVQMALDAGSGRLLGASDSRLVAWGRLPLQGLMIWAARQAQSGGGDD